MTSWKDCTNSEYESLRNAILEVYSMEDSPEDIDTQLSEVEDSGEKEHRSETSIENFRRQKREIRDRRGKGICCQRKAKGQFSRGDQCSFRHESNDRVQPTPQAAPPLSHQHQKEEVRRETGASEAELVWEDQSTAVQRLREGYLH